MIMKRILILGALAMDYNNTPWWLANETGQNKFTQGVIGNDGAYFRVDKNVVHKDASKKAFALPIRYF